MLLLLLLLLTRLLLLLSVLLLLLLRRLLLLLLFLLLRLQLQPLDCLPCPLPPGPCVVSCFFRQRHKFCMYARVRLRPLLPRLLLFPRLLLLATLLCIELLLRLGGLLRRCLCLGRVRLCRCNLLI